MYKRFFIFQKNHGLTHVFTFGLLVLLLSENTVWMTSYDMKLLRLLGVMRWDWEDAALIGWQKVRRDGRGAKLRVGARPAAKRTALQAGA